MVIYDVSTTHKGAASMEDLYRYRSIVDTVVPTGKEIEFSLVRRFETEDGPITVWESMQTPSTMLVELGMDRESFERDRPEHVTR